MKKNGSPTPCPSATFTACGPPSTTSQRTQTWYAAVAEAARCAIREAGLSLYLESGFSNTVTVFLVPEGVTDKDILTSMKKDHGILLAGSFGNLSGKVIRIGHMGENANVPDMTEVFGALDEVFAGLGVPLRASLKDCFLKRLSV